MPAPSIGSAHLPAVLVVGAASRDLDPADPRGWRLGGGVAYGSLAIARLGLPVRALLGADHEAAGATEIGLLRTNGVDVRIVPLARGPVFDNGPMGPRGGRVQVALQASDVLPATELPEEWRSSQAVVLAPVAGELADEWSDALDREALVGLGWQGLLRRLTAGEGVEALPIRLHPLIARADLALVSAEDAVAGGSPLVELLGRPGQQLVITHGHRPAIHVQRHETGVSFRLLPVEASQRVRDTTGAGDVMLAAWTASAAALHFRQRQPDARVLALATSAAAAKVERQRLDEMADLCAICARLLKPRD